MARNMVNCRSRQGHEEAAKHLISTPSSQSGPPEARGSSRVAGALVSGAKRALGVPPPNRGIVLARSHDPATGSTAGLQVPEATAIGGAVRRPAPISSARAPLRSPGRDLRVLRP